jgi:hypothetical protein
MVAARVLLGYLFIRGCQTLCQHKSAEKSSGGHFVSNFISRMHATIAHRKSCKGGSGAELVKNSARRTKLAPAQARSAEFFGEGLNE